MAHSTDDAQLEQLLEEFYLQLEEEDLGAAKKTLQTIEQAATGPDVLCARGQLAWAEGDLPAATRAYTEVVELDPEDADSWYALACLAEDGGDADRMMAAFLTVSKLDHEQDAVESLVDPDHEKVITEVAQRVLDDLPEEFREQLGNVPVVLALRPPTSMVEEGFDPRAFGLFEGSDHQGQTAQEVQSVPTRVVLFSANLVDAFPDLDELAEEVEVTVLHELAHYFGLDEEEVADVGLA